jgi:hypothetical protein
MPALTGILFWIVVAVAAFQAFYSGLTVGLLIAVPIQFFKDGLPAPRAEAVELPLEEDRHLRLLRPELHAGGHEPCDFYGDSRSRCYTLSPQNP